MNFNEVNNITNLTDKDLKLLQSAPSHVKLVLSNVAAEIEKEMTQREAILTKHVYKITQGKDGNWRTYLPLADGRKQVKRKDRPDVEDVVIAHYKEFREDSALATITFKDCYEKMIETHSLSFTSPNTIYKYESDYKRFFNDTAFESMDIADINEETIRGFILNTVKTLKLPKKSCRDLCGYIRNTLKSARINRLISENPFEYIEVKYFYPHCTEKVRTSNERTISNEEMTLLYERFQEDYIKRPTYMPTYAVEFASLTGMRVGEIAVLRWSEISDDTITIRHSEKFNRTTGERTIGDTKNHQIRYFPLTEEIKALLKRIKETEWKYGFISEFVFSDENGRVFSSKIADCAKVKSKQAGIPTKTIHSFRRTLSSKLKCNGVPSTVVGAIMGHSEQVNEQYYTYDVSDIKTKARYVQAVTTNIVK